MEAWCTAHPWMTFFIIMALLQGPLVVIRSRCKDDKK